MFKLSFLLVSDVFKNPFNLDIQDFSFNPNNKAYFNWAVILLWHLERCLWNAFMLILFRVTTLQLSWLTNSQPREHLVPLSYFWKSKKPNRAIQGKCETLVWVIQDEAKGQRFRKTSLTSAANFAHLFHCFLLLQLWLWFDFHPSML